MDAELRNYQAQVSAYKYEIERVDTRIKKCKDLYFQMRQQQSLGVVQEINEDAYEQQANAEQAAFLQQQQQQLAMQQQMAASQQMAQQQQQ